MKREYSFYNKTRNLALSTASVPLVVHEYDFGKLPCKKIQSFSFSVNDVFSLYGSNLFRFLNTPPRAPWSFALK